MTWGGFEAGAPEVARLGRARLEEARVALLGTLRADGSPRISPVEPFFAGPHLVFGAMARSLKVRDLLADARCVLHSPVSAPDAGEAELKLYGRAEEVRDAAIRAAPADAWWLSHPPETARVFSLWIERAAYVSWDLGRGEMRVRRWTPGGGVDDVVRTYP